MRWMIWLCLITLPATLPITGMAAEAYKCKGPKGETVFSDTPCGDGKTIELKEVPTYQAAPVPDLPPLPAKKKAKADSYQLSFAAPAPDAVLRDNEGKVNVEVSLKPGLGPDDFIQLKLDGELVGKKGRQTSWSLTGVVRGVHNLTVEVLDQNDKVLTSATTSFVLHQASANFGARIETPTKGGLGKLAPMPGDKDFVEPSREPGHEWAPSTDKDKKAARAGSPRR